MTKSDLTIGLIIEGSISRSDTASLIAAKSTTTGTPVKSINDAEIAAGKLLEKGASAAVITLGEQGALFKDNNQIIHQPSYDLTSLVYMENVCYID